MPKYLKRELSGDFTNAVNAVQQETERHLGAGSLFLGIARGAEDGAERSGRALCGDRHLEPRHPLLLILPVQGLMPYEQQDLVASLIEEADFSASLAETLHQVARRVKREKFTAEAQKVVTDALTRLEVKMREILPDFGVPNPPVPAGHVKFATVEDLREKTLMLGT